MRKIENVRLAKKLLNYSAGLDLTGQARTKGTAQVLQAILPAGRSHRRTSGGTAVRLIGDEIQMRVVKEVLGKKVQVGGQEHVGWLAQNAAQPRPIPLEMVSVDVRIFDEGAGFILEYEFQNHSGSNDSWHSTVKEAEEEAQIRFGIESSEWKSYSDADI